MRWSRESWIGLTVVLFAILLYYLLHWVGMAFLEAAWPGHDLERGSLLAVLLGPFFLAIALALTAAVAALPAWGLLFAMGVGRFLGHRLGIWPSLRLDAPQGAELRAHLGPARFALRNALEATIGLVLLLPLGLLVGGLLVAIGGGPEPGLLAHLTGYGLGFAFAWWASRQLVRYWGRLEALQADTEALLERGLATLEWLGQLALRWLNGGRLPED
ncbi:MAG: hypothetical protein ACLFMS_05475 [Halorhodospira sp.]